MNIDPTPVGFVHPELTPDLFNTPTTWTEARLQSEIFQWHWKHYKHERGLLFSVDNNANDRVKGDIRKAMGRIAGVSDLIFLRNGRAYFIEVKRPGENQKPVQRQWEDLVSLNGFDYGIVTSVGDFAQTHRQIILYAQILPF